MPSFFIRAGISLLGVVGMVAGHVHAHAVSLVRWGSMGLRGNEFTALITAISQVTEFVLACVGSLTLEHSGFSDPMILAVLFFLCD